MNVLFRGLCLESQNIQLNALFLNKKTKNILFEMAAEEMKPWSDLHGAVRPLLVADKVVGGEHHLADVTVKARFMPVLTEGEKMTI